MRARQFFFWRHLSRIHQLPHRAFVDIARNDHLSIFPAGHRALAVRKIQLAFRLRPAVAVETIGGEDWGDVAIEVERNGARSRRAEEGDQESEDRSVGHDVSSSRFFSLAAQWSAMSLGIFRLFTGVGRSTLARPAGRRQ